MASLGRILMKTLTIKIILMVVAVFLSGCDDTSENNNTNNANNVNNINNVNNVNNDVPPEFMEFPAKVVSVSDGDTIYVRYNDRTFKVRFSGVDAPEIAHSGTPADPYGVDAMDFTRDHLPIGSWVGLEFDDASCGSSSPPADCYDLYDRMLAYIRTLDDQDLSAQLIVNGLATVYTNADFNRKTQYLQYQQQAIDNHLGIWSK
jgi:micrococcal nuclease